MDQYGFQIGGYFSPRTHTRVRQVGTNGSIRWWWQGVHTRAIGSQCCAASCLASFDCVAPRGGTDSGLHLVTLPQETQRQDRDQRKSRAKQAAKWTQVNSGRREPTRGGEGGVTRGGDEEGRVALVCFAAALPAQSRPGWRAALRAPWPCSGTLQPSRTRRRPRWSALSSSAPLGSCSALPAGLHRLACTGLHRFAAHRLVADRRCPHGWCPHGSCAAQVRRGIPSAVRLEKWAILGGAHRKQ